jgi:hypothetical protein
LAIGCSLVLRAGKAITVPIARTSDARSI